MHNRGGGQGALHYAQEETGLPKQQVHDVWPGGEASVVSAARESQAACTVEGLPVWHVWLGGGRSQTAYTGRMAENW